MHAFDAGNIAIKLGDRRLINTIMLGAISEQLPFDTEVLEQSVLKRFAHKSDQLVELNRIAFAAGREAAQGN